MITIIKNGEVYSPEYLGKKDIVISGDTIEGIYENADLNSENFKINIIDAAGKIVTPGFIDSHVHIIGGGGEGGFRTRTPEIQLSEIILGGITSVVGCLGTDEVTRGMTTLLAKANALEEEGITTYIYTGSYKIPVVTLTGSCRSDLILINKIIGVGEVALSDNRSAQPTFEEFIKLVADARVGGLLSGKAGIVHVHMGDGISGLEYLREMADNTEIPITQAIPTHVNRNINLFKEALSYAKTGGIIDLTTSSDPNFLEKDEVKASNGLKMLLDSGIGIEHVHFSSDAQGSMPVFNDKKEFIGLGIGSVKSLFREFSDAVLKDGVKLEDALKVVTSNVAAYLKLKGKGKIAEDYSGDILILNKEDLSISDLFAKGKLLVHEGKTIVKGTFER